MDLGSWVTNAEKVLNTVIAVVFAVDGNLQILEDLEHADVRHAARAAAGQHQADPRARRRIGGRPGSG